MLTINGVVFPNLLPYEVSHSASLPVSPLLCSLSKEDSVFLGTCATFGFTFCRWSITGRAVFLFSEWFIFWGSQVSLKTKTKLLRSYRFWNWKHICNYSLSKSYFFFKNQKPVKFIWLIQKKTNVEKARKIWKLMKVLCHII